MIDPNSGQARQSSVSVTVTPSTASILPGQLVQFNAAVQNSPDPSVTWTVNDVLGGNATVGWISSVGFYTAPQTVPSPPTVTVSATSVATPTVSGSAIVTINAPAAITVSVTPSSATVRLRRTLQFSASVQGTTNQAVTWMVNGVTGGNSTVGTINSVGLYTAPGSLSSSSVTVQAVSVADPSKSGSATVRLKR